MTRTPLNTRTPGQTPIYQRMAEEVLEAAKDNNDPIMTAVCRRVLTAYRLGRPRDKADLALIAEFWS